MIALVQAQEDAGDYMVGNWELEKALSFVNGVIALALFTITLAAYSRDGRKRFLLVSLAFFLFSIKSFLISSELFIAELTWVEPVSIVFEFVVLLLFFSGVISREG